MLAHKAVCKNGPVMEMQPKRRLTATRNIAKCGMVRPRSTLWTILSDP